MPEQKDGSYILSEELDIKKLLKETDKADKAPPNPRGEKLMQSSHEQRIINDKN